MCVCDFGLRERERERERERGTEEVRERTEVSELRKGGLMK